MDAFGVLSTCSESIMEGKGLIDAKVGFIGGTKADPTYMEVCSGQTGDAEASQLTFEPVRIHV